VRQIKLATRQLLGGHKYGLSYRIVSYRIVSYLYAKSQLVLIPLQFNAPSTADKLDWLKIPVPYLVRDIGISEL